MVGFFGVLSFCLLILLTPSVHSGCPDTVPVTLTGKHITVIPHDLRKDVNYLSIDDTSITTLNLTVAGGIYPELCKITVRSSPINGIIAPIPPASVALKNFRLYGGYFPTLPDLGSVLAGQLEVLYLRNLEMTTIPRRYFQNYSNLVILNLAYNLITTLTDEHLFGLGRLKIFSLQNNNVNPLPPMYQWLPNLKRLDISRMDITDMSIPLLENLPYLRVLILKKNRIRMVPGQKHFINLEHMDSIDLKGNPLHCDYQLGWVKVNAKNTDNPTLAAFCSL